VCKLISHARASSDFNALIQYNTMVELGPERRQSVESEAKNHSLNREWDVINNVQWKLSVVW